MNFVIFYLSSDVKIFPASSIVFISLLKLAEVRAVDTVVEMVLAFSWRGFSLSYLEGLFLEGL